MKTMELSGKTARITLKEYEGDVAIFALMCGDDELFLSPLPKLLSKMAFNRGAWKVVHDYNLALDPDEQNAHRRK